MEISMWNQETDILDNSLNAPTYWAYSLNTKVGQYKMAKQKVNVTDENNEFSCSFTEERQDLLLICDDQIECVARNVFIWPQNYYDDFMVFHTVADGHTYLIDSRGQIFLTGFQMRPGDNLNAGYVTKNTREGYYCLSHHYFATDGFRMRYKGEKKRRSRKSI